MRHIAAKKYNMCPRGTGSGVNASLVSNECCIIFLSQVDKTDFITAIVTVMKKARRSEIKQGIDYKQNVFSIN